MSLHPPLWHNCGAGSLGGASLLRGAAAVRGAPAWLPRALRAIRVDRRRRGSRARKMAGRRVGFLGGGDFAFFNVPSSLFFALAACVLWRRVGASVLDAAS